MASPDTAARNGAGQVASPAAGSRGRLERFRKAKERELAALQQGIPAPFEGLRPSFRDAISRNAPGRGRACGDGKAPVGQAPVRKAPVPVIAEYKRASPSRGTICGSVPVEDAVLAFAGGGASALSILTEEEFFQGSLDFLLRARTALDAAGFGDIPLLRKDFLFDERQVLATAATPASAFLLIVRQNPDAKFLRDLRETGEAFGMDAVVEVFDEEDLEIARASGARIIQVNARDLETFAVDRMACLALAERCPPAQGEVWIAASGMEEAGHLEAAHAAGYAAALVGTALMRGGRLEENLARLVDGA